MPAYSDLVHEVTASTGTSTLTLAAVNGKRSFNTAFGTGGSNLFDYYISHRSAAEWERGLGHLSAAATLVRDTVLASSNAGATVNFSAGAKDVTNDQPAGKRFDNTGGIMTGALVLSYADPVIQLNKAASGNAAQIIGLKGGTARWALKLGDEVAETGSGNAGSDFAVFRYPDAGGAPIDSPLVISRSTGKLTTNGFAGSIFTDTHVAAGGQFIATTGASNGYTIASNGVLFQQGAYTFLMGAEGGATPAKILLGDAATDATTYSDNTVHRMRSRDGSATFVRVNGTDVNILMSTAAVSNTTGALTVAGGVGVGGSVVATSYYSMGTGIGLQLCLGATGNGTGNNLRSIIRYVGAGEFGLGFWSNTDGTNDVLIYNAAGTLTGGISHAAALTSFNTTSDARLKRDLKPLRGALDLINKFKVYDHGWKNAEHRSIGVTAQEAIEVLADMVTPGNDEESVPWMVDYSKGVPALFAAVQELTKRVEALEAHFAQPKQ